MSEDRPPKLISSCCQAPLELSVENARECTRCRRQFPSVAGLPDLRLRSDRYLDLDAERAKAERLHALEPHCDLPALAAAYYAMTDDVVDHRRERFLRHIASAEARGEALLERLPPQGTILEVGCGTGGLLAAAMRAGRSILGVDIAARWLVVARRRLTDLGYPANLIVAEAERLPWPEASFDIVVADSLLEHLDDPARGLAECRRVLRPGGTIVVWSPNRFTVTTDPHLGLWGLGWLPRACLPWYLSLRGRDNWVPRTLSARAACRLAESTGLEQVSIDPPVIPTHWARTRRPVERLPLELYAVARRLPPTRAMLRAIGPLWELRAEARRSA